MRPKLKLQAERLNFIRDTVLLCQRFAEHELPLGGCNKVLRESIFFLWEQRHGGNKEATAQFRSLASVGKPLGSHSVVYDHVIPVKLILAKLLAKNSPSTAWIKNTLQNLCISCLITKEEDLHLNSLGLRSAMPSNWDQRDRFARYHSAGISYEPNPLFSGDPSSL